jgi:hypothetical protein
MYTQDLNEPCVEHPARNSSPPTGKPDTIPSATSPDRLRPGVPFPQATPVPHVREFGSRPALGQRWRVISEVAIYCNRACPSILTMAYGPDWAYP